MFKRYFSAVLIVVALAVAATACTTVAPSPPMQKTALWKVTSAHRTLYVTGSTQTLSKSDYPLPQPVMQAFSKSGELIEEGGCHADKQKVQATVMELAVLPSGQTLTGMLTASQLELVKNATSGGKVPFAVLNRMRPWLAALVVQQETQTRLGIDPHDQPIWFFCEQATTRKIPVTPLKTPVDQMKMFAAIPSSLQLEWLILEVKISQMGTTPDRLRSVREAWRDGDTSTLAKYEKQEFQGQPALYKALVTDRNAMWMKTLESRLATEGEPVFVIVGAGHLVGADNLLTDLRQAGYHVTQL